ncbi:DinB family protein [Micromonospora sp. MS34]|uniref:DinB family protein n=1 Tax=Micromonospora sp. MS34 TaxID=3385971 RepID=UPI0039A31D04
MAGTYEHTDDFRDARFTDVDLAGARFLACDLSGVRIRGAALVDVRISGDLDRLVVNDVDVTAYVAAELDRRHPERVRVRRMSTADDHRATCPAIERRWAETVARAERLPETARHERVDEEWSFVETLRHLVFATDLWARHMIVGDPEPYHRLALPPTDYPAEDEAALDLDRDARPSYAAVLAVRAGRMALVRGIVDRLTDEELDRICPGPLPAAWEESPQPVGECLRVIMQEEIEHRRYAERDLAVLAAR